MCKRGAYRLDGQTALVTGGGSGMGYEAARALAGRGARVILASRNASKLARACSRLRASTRNPRVEYRVFDLSSLRAVRGLAQQLAREPRLDMLVNNAGEIGLPDARTEDGLSLMMQVNFFAPFLLTYLLFPLLRRSKPSRIVSTEAVTMYFGHIDFDHWNDLDRYDVIQASGNAKLASFIMSAEWARRGEDSGVTSNTLDPFITRDTDLSKRVFGQITESLQLESLQLLWKMVFELIASYPEDIGREIAYYASSPDMANVTGHHYAYCRQLPRHLILDDMDLRKRLWDEAKRIVNITAEEDWEAQG